MGRLQVRWSDQEARKPYARPFGVSFWSDGNDPLLSIAVSGADLLYYRQFQGACLQLAGQLFCEPVVEVSPEPQRAWLDILADVLAPATDLTLVPHSIFDETEGRVFRFRPAWDNTPWAEFGADTVLDYQEFQAAIAHQTGRLYRNQRVEPIDDDLRQHRIWVVELGGIIHPPDVGDAAKHPWPWRPPRAAPSG